MQPMTTRQLNRACHAAAQRAEIDKRVSRPLSAVIGTVFNMTATVATFGSVLLYLIAAKHFT